MDIYRQHYEELQTYSLALDFVVGKDFVEGFARLRNLSCRYYS